MNGEGAMLLGNSWKFIRLQVDIRLLQRAESVLLIIKAIVIILEEGIYDHSFRIP